MVFAVRYLALLALGALTTPVLAQGAVSPHQSIKSTAAAETQTETPKYPSRRPRLGLALGGGGTRGLAHLGILKVLAREGIQIDCVAGTSMGAIIGGLYCAGVSVDTIEQMFLDKKLLRAYYTVPLPVRIAVMPVFAIPHALGYRTYEGLYRGNKFRKFLEKSLPEDCQNIENLKIPFCAVASNLVDGTAVTLNHGSLARALQASSAVPVLRKPVVYDDKLLVDGGLECNLPIDQAKELGADIVIAIDVDETFLERPKDFKKNWSVDNRAISMMLARIDRDELKKADIVIKPDVNGITLLSRRIKDGTRALNAGERAATDALPAIRARLASFQK